jgi:hypothetical protein
MQSDPLKQRDFSALRFSTLVGRRGGVAALERAHGNGADAISRRQIA